MIDCPKMHEGQIDDAKYYPAKSTNEKIACVCNDDVGGIYTSTTFENMRPFLYTDWKNSDFEIPLALKYPTPVLKYLILGQ